MGWLKKLKRQVMRPVNTYKSVAGKLKGGDDSSRSEAAGQLLQKKEVPVNRQAGSGQVKFTGEVYE
jgi:hypothetical protein